VTWWPWHRKLEQSDEAVRAAEELRDHAQQQQKRAEAMSPRVEAVSSSLQRLRTDNHFGPLIDALLRGGNTSDT
jgi:hypothetical protein